MFSDLVVSGNAYKLPYHIILGSRGEPRLLEQPLRASLCRQLGTIIGQMHGEMLLAGGRRDHLHVLCLLPALDSVTDMMRLLKQGSREWIREALGLRGFDWQGVSGASVVSSAEAERLCREIEKRDPHARKSRRTSSLAFSMSGASSERPTVVPVAVAGFVKPVVGTAIVTATHRRREKS